MSFTPTILRNRIALALAGVIILGVALSAYFYLQSAKDTPSTSQEASTASSTDSSALPEPTAGKKGLPPEPSFSLPDGAVAVDGYAFKMDEGVYMRSLTGKNPLQILNADADSFERLADFSSYSSNGVINDCGAKPVYTYYGDNKHVYFYQIWRTPYFRTSQIEVIAGAKKDGFEMLGTDTATDGTRRFEVGHMVTASSTCLLTLRRVGT